MVYQVDGLSGSDRDSDSSKANLVRPPASHEFSEPGDLSSRSVGTRCAGSFEPPPVRTLGFVAGLAPPILDLYV